jgi:hypothetical protein
MIIVGLETDIGYIHATYRGREYIDIGVNGHPPQDIINVFDYGTNSPRIKNTQGGRKNSEGVAK